VTSCVIDASVAVKWYVAEKDSNHAHELLTEAAVFAAPSLLRVELASALWKNCQRNYISQDQMRDALTSIEKTTIAFWYDTDLLLPAAIELAFSIQHHVYDCLYLTLAQQLGSPLITADKQLLSVAPNDWAVALADWKL